MQIYTVIYCLRGDKMNIKVNSTLMIPIYEQIVDQIKTLIRIGKLEENDMLPSVRSLSKE